MPAVRSGHFTKRRNYEKYIFIVCIFGFSKFGVGGGGE
jgi:hypothetical protein